jgi:hypothetical protein
MELRKRKMIKWIKSIIEKFFGKFCKCEEPVISEDEEKYLAEEKTLADYAESFKEIIEPEKIQCNTHSRFKKSCPTCVEAAK